MKLNNDPPRNRPAQPPNDTANNNETETFQYDIIMFRI